MSRYNFTKPDALKPEKDKPGALANSDIPLRSIDHRRFEKLCYWIFRGELERGDLRGQYDDILLMSGVRDDAQDCALYSKTNLTAVIQCKHSQDDTPLSVPKFLTEVLKFALYDYVEKIVPSLSDFTYYIASSSGFNRDCGELIGNFNASTPTHGSLETWTKSLIKSIASLKHLRYESIREPLIHFLANLRVKKIDGEEINRLLTFERHSESVRAFFELRTVIDPKALDPIMEQLENLTRLPSINDVRAMFDAASFFLRDSVSYIDDTKRIHIDRPEVSSVLSWIKTPLASGTKPLALVFGDSGCGKTVVMKSVYQSLVADGIPVLGIKCDAQNAEDPTTLERILGFTESLSVMIDILQDTDSLVVILIDQLDALSQTLSSNRKPLGAYRLLIEKLLAKGGVRVVVSTRTFDLTYDPDLSSLSNNAKFKLGIFSEAEVKSILSKLGVDIARISPRLLQTLRVPNHLKVFCKIQSPQLSLEGITELHDLYGELWKQVVLQKVPQSLITTHVAQCIYALAKMMNENQQVVVSRQRFDSDYFSDLNYLLSAGLLTQNMAFIGFFHQSFYDYSYARHFVEQEKDLTSYVKSNLQTLHVRSSVKTIVTFLRSASQTKYLSALNNLLLSSSINFHIKLLIIQGLGYNLEPSASEFSFVKKYILARKELRRSFLESTFGARWLDFLITNKVLDSLFSTKHGIADELIEVAGRKIPFVKRILERLGHKDNTTKMNENVSLGFSMVTRSLPQGRIVVAKYLLNVPVFPGIEWVVQRFLYNVKDWDFPEIFSLFEKNESNLKNDAFIYSHVLENIALTGPRYALGRFKEFALAEKVSKRSKDQMYDYYVVHVFKVLSEICPGDTFFAGVEVVRTIANRSRSNFDAGPQLFDSPTFMFYDDDNRDREGSIYGQLIGMAERFAKENSPAFSEFARSNVGENSISVLRILVRGLNANPEAFLEKGFEFICVFASKSGFNEDRKIVYEVGMLIGRLYSRFSVVQRTVINDILLNISLPGEFSIYEFQGKRGHYLMYSGRQRYLILKTIPEHLLLAEPRLRTHYQELARKFPSEKVYTPTAGPSFGNSFPIAVTSLERLAFEQWEESFHKYDSEGVGMGLLEHSRAFQETVKGNPGRFISFVRRLVEENSVSVAYWVKGLEGLVAANYSPQEVLTIYKVAISRKLNREYTLYLVWLVEFFTKHHLTDLSVIEFLSHLVHNHADPSEVAWKDDLHMSGINSVRGAAISQILNCTHNKDLMEPIFCAAETASNDPVSSVRATLAARCANLIRHDKHRAMKVFLTATSSNDPQVILAAIHSLKYFIHHGFEHLLPSLRNWIKHDSVQEDIAPSIIWSWVKDFAGSGPLMNRLLRKSPKARAMAVRLSYEHMLDPEELVQKKCAKLFYRFLDDGSKEVRDQYNLMFLHLDENGSFSRWLPYVLAYSKSSAVASNPQYFMEYLLKKAASNPRECLDLIGNIKKFPRPDISQGPYYEDQPVRVVLTCYNSLHNLGDTVYVQKSIAMFDRLLKIDFLRQSAGTALDLVER